MALPLGKFQRRIALPVAHSGIGVSPQQTANHARAAMVGRTHQRGTSVLVFVIDVCTTSQQQINHVIVAVNCGDV